MGLIFKVIIAGGRDFNNYELLKEKVDFLLQNKGEIEIVSGAARGADKLGERYAKEKGYPINSHPANWDLYGKSAGYIRNKEMAKYANALIAFWDGKSKGTNHMINLAKECEIFVRVVYY
ncbi:DUF2493 domain-containing protein [Lysinibacillus sphaericus]|uniref:DUF2493 domain-containing protein n=1 Tax=Lysinibacillus sphaericus TaxID=1421 RepID=UPI000A48E9C6|nr:DUF2493 domain-containing protein [Lysinibacillus sphaericus]